MRRRDLLAWASLLAVGPVLERAAWAATSEAAGAMEAAADAGPAAAGQAAAMPVRQPASLGYLEGSDLLDDLRKLPVDLRRLTVTSRGGVYQAARRIVPAAELSSGDPALAGVPLRMTVRGLYPATLVPISRMPRAIDFDVYVPCPELGPRRTARFQAWSYRRLPAENRSAGLSFVVQADWGNDLSISARVVPADPAAPPLLLQATFTLADTAGRPRLARGAYLLGLAPEVWSEDVDLPANPARVPAELLSLLITISPEGVQIPAKR